LLLSPPDELTGLPRVSSSGDFQHCYPVLARQLPREQVIDHMDGLERSHGTPRVRTKKPRVTDTESPQKVARGCCAPDANCIELTD